MARYKTEQRELAYRIYISDSLQIVTRVGERYAERINLAEDLMMDYERIKLEEKNKKLENPKQYANEIIKNIQDGLNSLVADDRKEED